MKVTFDPSKRDATVSARELDFADAEKVFAGTYFTRRDERRDYGEDRFISIGQLDRTTVVLVWTPRPGSRRRKANAKEQALYSAYANIR